MANPSESHPWLQKSERVVYICSGCDAVQCSQGETSHRNRCVLWSRTLVPRRRALGAIDHWLARRERTQHAVHPSDTGIALRVGGDAHNLPSTPAPPLRRLLGVRWSAPWAILWSDPPAYPVATASFCVHAHARRRSACAPENPRRVARGLAMAGRCTVLSLEGHRDSEERS